VRILDPDSVLSGRKIYTGSSVTSLYPAFVGCATGTFLLNARSRGYKRVKEGGPPKSLMRGET
jgi:hypothetical protein